jgi:hypothetical protein
LSAYSQDYGSLYRALWALYELVKDDHSGTHYEPECPTCRAVREIQKYEGQQSTGEKA